MIVRQGDKRDSCCARATSVSRPPPLPIPRVECERASRAVIRDRFHEHLCRLPAIWDHLDVSSSIADTAIYVKGNALALAV